MKESQRVKGLRETLRERTNAIRMLREALVNKEEEHAKSNSYTTSNYEQRIMNLNNIYDDRVRELKRDKNKFVVLFSLMTAINVAHLIFHYWPV